MNLHVSDSGHPSSMLAKESAFSEIVAGSTAMNALIAKAKVDRKENQALLAQSMIRLAPYNVSL